MMKVVTQKGTLSGRRDRTISILCSSLQEFSHSPGARQAEHVYTAGFLTSSQGYSVLKYSAMNILVLMGLNWGDNLVLRPSFQT